MILVDVSYVQNFETKRLQANKCVKKSFYKKNNTRNVNKQNIDR